MDFRKLSVRLRIAKYLMENFITSNKTNIEITIIAMKKMRVGNIWSSHLMTKNSTRIMVPIYIG